MANKSFTIQYLIKARDEFSEAGAKARKSVKNLRDEVKRTSAQFDAFRKKTAWLRQKGAIMSAAVTAPIALLGFSMKNAARDAEETRSKFNTVFRDISVQSQTAADNLARDFGLTGTQARKLVGDTGDLLTGFGFAQDEALKVSTRVNELAVDLASFTNFSGGAEGASAALTKALLGERESLKSLGIAISEENVKQEIGVLLSQGQTFESLRQAKAHATLSLAVKQSGNAIGDFARTQEQLANQERITAARLSDVKEAMGRLLLPVALKLTQAVRGIAEAFLATSPAFKKTLLVIAAIAAAIGPLLLGAGSLVLMWPAMAAGAAIFGATAAAAFGPLLPIIGAVSLGAFLIIKHWAKLKAFFAGFADGLSSTVGPALGGLLENVREAAVVVAQLFGADSEATESLENFTNVGQLMGEVLGGVLSTLIRAFSGMGEVLGQLVGAALSLDFSNFDVDAIKAEFLGPAAQPAAIESNVNVGVQVGLEKGLTQTGAATIASTGTRRADVGAN